jgi:hypothetical protein
MTRDEVRQIEEAIAVVVKRLRGEFAGELEPLRDRLTAAERDLAAYEARIGEWLRQPKRGAR